MTQRTGLTTIVQQPGVGSSCDVPIRTNHHGNAVRIGGAEFGRMQGLQPVCERLPATAVVPATTCLSFVPSRMVTTPAVVSTCVCEHSTSTRKLSAWPA